MSGKLLNISEPQFFSTCKMGIMKGAIIYASIVLGTVLLLNAQNFNLGFQSN